MAPRKRRRRTPEEARALILESAAAVFAELGPDRAGLKEVASRAGVSHALVTHYFGTFDALVEEVLSAKMDEQREVLLRTIVESTEGIPIAELVRYGVESLREPVVSRLLAWAFLSGRIERSDFFAHERQGLRRVVEAIAAHPDVGKKLDRDEIEQRVIILWSALMGYSAAGATLWQAMGREPDAERDAAIERALVEIATAGL